MTREAEIAWAAGLFEGEGSWGYQPNNVRAELSMTDPDVVERFFVIVGVGRLESRKTYKPHHKPQLVWRVTDRAGVQAVLAMFRPWLSGRRLARGEEVLRLQAEVTAAIEARRAQVCRNGHPRTPENVAFQRSRRTGEMTFRCRACDRAKSREYRAAAGASR